MIQDFKKAFIIVFTSAVGQLPHLQELSGPGSKREVLLLVQGWSHPYRRLHDFPFVTSVFHSVQAVYLSTTFSRLFQQVYGEERVHMVIPVPEAESNIVRC